jgi:hypothetical protein
MTPTKLTPQLITEIILKQPQFKDKVEAIVTSCLRDKLFIQALIESTRTETSFEENIIAILDKHLGQDTTKDKLTQHILDRLAHDSAKEALEPYLQSRIKSTMLQETRKLRRFWLPLLISTLSALFALGTLIVQILHN